MEKHFVTDAALVARRRQQIFEAAVELFAKQGYFRTTMQEIARRAGVSIGLIYQYCVDKDDVLLLVLLNVVDAYKARIPAAIEGVSDPLQRFKIAVEAYCRIVDSMRDATVLAYRSTKSLAPDKREIIKERERETNLIISGCIESCIAAGLFRPVNVDVVTYQIIMFAHAWALKYWHFRQSTTLDDYIADGLETFLRGLQR